MPLSTWLITSLIAAATAPGVSCSRTKRDPASNFEWDSEAFKVAAVRKPPVGYVYHSLSNRSTWFNCNLSATITQSVDIIHQAAAEGVKFIAFPELYFPGSVLHNQPLAHGSRSILSLGTRLFEHPMDLMISSNMSHRQWCLADPNGKPSCRPLQTPVCTV